MTAIPESARPFKRTDVFTESTVPAGLLRDHQTKAGVWGKIHVVSGRLRYTIPSRNEETLLGPERAGIVEPEVPHFVTPMEAVSFYVEFWR